MCPYFVLVCDVQCLCCVSMCDINIACVVLQCNVKSVLRHIVAAQCDLSVSFVRCNVAYSVCV